MLSNEVLALGVGSEDARGRSGDEYAAPAGTEQCACYATEQTEGCCFFELHLAISSQ